ncbi:MAG TPA: hypothetical protein VIV66_20560 [Pyrinomonadaceae bacterium]
MSNFGNPEAQPSIGFSRLPNRKWYRPAKQLAEAAWGYPFGATFGKGLLIFYKETNAAQLLVWLLTNR